MTTHNHLDEARLHWGYVFREFEIACELVRAACHSTENKQALKSEDIQRLRSLIKIAQKKIDAWTEVKS